MVVAIVTFCTRNSESNEAHSNLHRHSQTAMSSTRALSAPAFKLLLVPSSLLVAYLLAVDCQGNYLLFQPLESPSRNWSLSPSLLRHDAAPLSLQDRGIRNSIIHIALFQWYFQQAYPAFRINLCGWFGGSSGVTDTSSDLTISFRNHAFYQHKGVSRAGIRSVRYAMVTARRNPG